MRTVYPGGWQTSLSPCDTNLANESPGKGQELVVLSLAGKDQVVSDLWKLEDAAGSLFLCTWGQGQKQAGLDKPDSESTSVTLSLSSGDIVQGHRAPQFKGVLL